MPSPKLLLAVLLLLVINVAAENATVYCTKLDEYALYYNDPNDTTVTVHVNFKFESIGPVFPGSSVSFTNNFVYAVAKSARWNGPLVFKATLEHYAPYQQWVAGLYKCVYKNGNKTDERYYSVVEKIPNRTKTEVIFKVPATAAEYSNSTSVKVTLPRGEGLCAALPTVDSWPSCPRFEPEPNKVSVDYPDSWEALNVNGYKPGDVVSAYGVNATIPNPWLYGIKSNVGTLSYVEIGIERYGPDVRDVPVWSSVSLHMVGMPKEWGEVKIIGAQVPLYVLSKISSRVDPLTLCRPPDCVVLVLAKSTCPFNPYCGVAAVRSGIMMNQSAWLDLGVFRGSGIYLPLGSVMKSKVYVSWSSGVEYILVEWDKVYLRVINNSTYYEYLGRNGKLVANPGYKAVDVAFAVDKSVPLIELSAYSSPKPHFVGTIPEPWYMITYGLYSYYSNLTGGRYPDLLHFLYGEPTTYYWGIINDVIYRGLIYGEPITHHGPITPTRYGWTVVETGLVSVHIDRRYENTTADVNGTHKLYHVSGKLPTDTVALNPWAPMIQIAGGGGGGGGGTGTVSPWLVWLVPTAACRSMFCTSLSPEVLGPLPPFPGDRALPNMGYSIMLMHIGETGRRRVKIYVEDGYIISSGPPMNVSRVRNYRLMEIDKEWRPFEAVVVGPGWWVPYRQLNACGSMPVSASSIYATPDKLGPVKVTVEDNGRNSTYVFYVTNDVKYRITTRTPAPESITGTPFNITAYITLGGVPYYHAVYSYGEGGRLSPPACASTWYNGTRLTSQLALSGDFWGSFGLANMLLKPVNIRYSYTKPRIELVNPWRGLVRVRADGPVSGFAFYAQRSGTWVKIGEVSTKVGNEYRGCILVNASKIFPWDPILVLPLVEQELEAAPGSTVAIWRPETALLFKTWADVVGYPKGARSELKVVDVC